MPRKDIPGSKMYQATLPAVLHDYLRRAAEEAAALGGQVNINKVIVQKIYESVAADLTTTERREVEAFIRKL